MLRWEMTNADWIRSHVDYCGDDCLKWPFPLSRSGYGKCSIGQKTLLAHRFMCELAHGAPPFPKAQAAHSCGNAWCVNPKHIRWATAGENNRERDTHGTLPKGSRVKTAVLSEDQVKLIASDERDESLIAKEHGVSPHTIRAIKDGRNWKWLTGMSNVRGYSRGEDCARSVLSEQQVLAIYNDKRPSHVVASEYKVSKSAIEAIRYRKTWTWLTVAA